MRVQTTRLCLALLMSLCAAVTEAATSGNLMSDPGYETSIGNFVTNNIATALSLDHTTPIAGSGSLRFQMTSTKTAIGATYVKSNLGAFAKAGEITFATKSRADLTSAANLRVCLTAYYADSSTPTMSCTTANSTVGAVSKLAITLNGVNGLNSNKLLTKVRVSLHQLGAAPIRYAIDQSLLTITRADSPMQVGTNFWDLGWGIWSDTFKSGVNFATTTNPWNPAFLSEISRYNVLRFMDFGQVNRSTEKNWADRTPKAAQPPAQQRLAFEWMIDLSNRTGADMWVNVPTFATDAYVYQLAKLIYGTLDPSLKVYVEWTNEVWNGGFAQQHDYSCSQGSALGLDSNLYIACAEYYVYRSVRIFKQFERVFGTTSPRLVKVLAGQAINPYLTSIHINALADPSINPEGIKASAYAIAPYFGHEIDGSAANAVTALKDNISSGPSNAMEGILGQEDVLIGSGLYLIAYEGGQHVTTGANIVNADPGMYAVYTQYLNAIAPHLKVFSHYLHNGGWGWGGAWGATQHVGDSLSQSHKLRAIFDWIDAHP